MTEVVQSPCTGVCRLNPRNVCIGCGRDIEEIIAWASLPASAQRNIAEAAMKRLAELRADESAEKK